MKNYVSYINLINMIIVIKQLESDLEFDSVNIKAIGFYKNTCTIHFLDKNIKLKLFNLIDFYWKLKPNKV
jgi:hypothetical protein